MDYLRYVVLYFLLDLVPTTPRYITALPQIHCLLITLQIKSVNPHAVSVMFGGLAAHVQSPWDISVALHFDGLCQSEHFALTLVCACHRAARGR